MSRWMMFGTLALLLLMLGVVTKFVNPIPQSKDAETTNADTGNHKDEAPGAHKDDAPAADPGLDAPKNDPKGSGLKPNRAPDDNPADPKKHVKGNAIPVEGTPNAPKGTAPAAKPPKSTAMEIKSGWWDKKEEAPEKPSRAVPPGPAALPKPAANP
jgi:hypothetical protein